MDQRTTFQRMIHGGCWLLATLLVQCGASAPSLVSISPSHMDTNGGKPITLTGQGFANGATVTIGGTETTQVTVRSSTEMVVTVPPHPGLRGFVPVVVKNPDTEPVTRSDLFSYHPGKLRLNPALLTTLGKNPTRVISADLNRDNQTDLVVVYGGNVADLFLGKGDGGFTKGTPLAPKRVDRDPILQDAVVGDLDGDGIVDIVLDNTNTYDAQVFIGKGDGTFLPPVSYSLRRKMDLANPPNPHGMLLADVNADGRIDLLVACGGGSGFSDSLAVLLNGPGGLQPVQHVDTTTQQRWPLYLAQGDLNGDGKPDVAMNYLNDLNTSRISVFLNTGDSLAPFLVSTPYPTPLQVADFGLFDINGDQKLDALVTLAKGGVGMLPGHGDGTFDDFVSLAEEPGTGALGMVDFNQDGMLDVVISTNPPPSTLLSPIKVLLGRGNGTFDPEQWLAYTPAKLGGGQMVLADVNGDGLLDNVALYNAGYNAVGTLAVLLNTSQ